MTQPSAWWDRHPAGSALSDRPRGSPEFFAEVDRARAALLPHLAPFADPAAWRDRRVLEIGCGLGAEGLGFIQAGAEYTGIELSGTSLALMRTRLDRLGLDATLIQADAADLAAHVRAASFDLVFAHDVLPYAADPDALLGQARRALGGQGELRLTAHARNSWRHAMAQAGHPPPDHPAGAPQGRATTAAELRATLRAHDFSVMRIDQDHLHPHVGERPDTPLQPWFAVMPPDMLQALRQLAGSHLLAVARPG